MPSNPLKLDPSRTVSLRGSFARDIRRRFAALAKAVEKYLDDDDSLGLKRSEVVRSLLSNAEGDLSDSASKLAAFQQWFRTKAKELALGDVDTPWVATYLKQAYTKGLTRGYDQVNKKKRIFQDEDVFSTSKTNWTLSNIRSKAVLDKLSVLTARTVSKLESYITELDSELTRKLSEVLLKKDPPKGFGKELAKLVNEFIINRDVRLANTEVMKAHSEAQLDAYERLGITEVSLEVEWVTAEDSRVCSRCAEKSGRRYTIAEARDLLPFHPNCRCIWVPVL